MFEMPSGNVYDNTCSELNVSELTCIIFFRILSCVLKSLIMSEGIGESSPAGEQVRVETSDPHVELLLGGDRSGLPSREQVLAAQRYVGVTFG